MKQLTAKDNPAFAHMTATAADVWAVISVLKLVRLLGIKFIMAVLIKYFGTEIDHAIGQLSDANNEQTGLIKKLGKIISIDAGLKTIFSGVKVRDMKTIPKYDKSKGGLVEIWIMAFQADLMRIDWKEFEKRVKSGSVGDDCPVKFELETSVSVNYEDLLKFHGPPSERMVIQVVDENDVGLSETAIIYPDVGPHPAPIRVKPSDAPTTKQFEANFITAVKQTGLSFEEIRDVVAKLVGLDAAPVPIEAAPQATGELIITAAHEGKDAEFNKPNSDDDKRAEVTDEQLQSMIDKHKKLTAPDDIDLDDIPF